MIAKRAAVFLALAALMLFPNVSQGLGAVPKPVLDARGSLVRVFSRSGGVLLSGTGFAVGQAQPVLYIVTSFHITPDEAAKITVMSGETLFLEASVFAKNQSADLCVLRLEAPLDIPPIAIEHNAMPEVGDAVYALGFPAASDMLSSTIAAAPEDVTVTDGIISAMKKGVLAKNAERVALLQTTAAFSGGNSGGPLLNENGHAVGVNTLTVTGAQSINAAVAAEELIALLDTAGVVFRAAELAQPEPEFALWPVAAAVALAAALLVFMLLRGKQRKAIRRKAKPLEAYFGGAAPLEQKLAALKGLAGQLTALHRTGRYGFDICPENIDVADGSAALKKAALRPDSSGALPARPGFSAPERYSGGAAGPWSDVYALSALVFWLIEGSAPPPAFERTGKKLFSKSIAAGLKPLAKAAEAGLCVDAQKRPPMERLFAELRTLLPDAAVDEKQRPRIYPAAYRAVAALCIAIVLAGGALLVSHINYAEGLKHMQDGAFAKSAYALGGVPAFYRDTAQLRRYVQAMTLLEDADYAQAEELFSSLGSFRDAADRSRQAAYGHALQWLETGSYQDARAAFLALGGFADARQLADEALLRQAEQNMKDGALLEAQAALKALHPYGDSGVLLRQLSDKIYEKALAYLAREQYASAEPCFSAISGHQKADAYAALCTLAVLMQEGGFGRAHYEQLSGIAAQVDISRLVLHDAAIRYYLEGAWKHGGDTFALQPDGSIGTSLPWDGGTYFFRGGALVVRPSQCTETEAFLFGYIDNDTMSLYCFANAQTYTFVRQPR